MTTRALREHASAAISALALCLLAGSSAALVLQGAGPVRAGSDLSWLLLLAMYGAASQVATMFQRRADGLGIALVQLPLALGLVLLAPPVHLAVRLAALATECALRRRSPVKALVNLAMAAVEVAAASAVVGLLGTRAHPGPALWATLLAGLLLAELASQAVFSLVALTLGLPRTQKEVLELLALDLVTTSVLTGLAILTLAAAWTDPWTLVVVVVLTAVLALSYRAYSRMSSQQRATDELYAFVKGLGPVDVQQDEAHAVLEHVRDLLHARELELVVADRASDVGCCLRVALDAEPSRTDTAVQPYAPGPDLQSRGMTTPLVAGEVLIGVLTARHRLSTDRGFDMRDLRLFETVAAELATAIDRGRLLRELGRAARTDPMTGLPNLHTVTGGLDALLAEHARVVLVAVAVDSFREVNDTLGHQVGDDLLREVAARLHTTAPGALIGRIGGGRFAVALPHEVAGGDAAMFALRLRADVEGMAQLGAVGTHIRLSAGCVVAPEHGTDAATLLRRAETAMYSARLAHGGPVQWEPAYEVQGQRRLAVVMALREALTTGAISVAFQPKVSVRTGRVTGVEALVRWAHPALGQVEPEEFVPLSEAAGLMSPLTGTVLRQALAACRAWQPVADGVGVAVNVTADTLQDGGFITEVSAALRDAGVSPGLLTLELTEDVVVADPQLAAERMHELQALGVKLSVDDFGTGYSSLTYLKGLPIDEVKIDKGFVSGLTVDLGDQAVVRAVVDIAHTLGLTVVAEGVENQDQHDMLARLGVDVVQGFLHARPMPAHDMAGWFAVRQEGVERLA